MTAIAKNEFYLLAGPADLTVASGAVEVIAARLEAGSKLHVPEGKKVPILGLEASEIEVSCKELDFLVEVALQHGAYGAKMTGGGLGGYMVALTPGKELQEKVAEAIEKEGFYALRTKIGI